MPVVRRFEDASAEVKDLIDPTWRFGEKYRDEHGEALRSDSEYLDRYLPAATEAPPARQVPQARL